MKIMVCVWGLSGGGAERVAVTLANALRDLGNIVQLNVTHPEGPFAALINDGLEVSAPVGRSHWAGFSHLRREIERFKPDVIISHQTPRNVLAILANYTVANRRARRLVIVEHGEMDYNSRQKGLGRKVYYWAARYLYRFADSLVACSENIRLAAVDYISGRLPSTSLPNPVIDAKVEALAQLPATHPWLIDSEAPVFVGLGRLVDQKNFLLLIEAFALVLKMMDARLVIFGDGAQRDMLQAAIETRNLTDKIILAGSTTNPFAELRRAQTLVLSSKWEGLPTVAIEAIYCGAQVVSTDNSSGIHDILDEGRIGWIVSADAKSLADAMVKSIKEPKQKELLGEHALMFKANVSGQKYLDHVTAVLRQA